jgi:hypothetical protein
MPCDTTAASTVKQETWSLLYDTTAAVIMKQQTWPMTYHTTESKAADVANDLRYKSTQSAKRRKSFHGSEDMHHGLLGYDVLL